MSESEDEEGLFCGWFDEVYENCAGRRHFLLDGNGPLDGGRAAATSQVALGNDAVALRASECHAHVNRQGAGGDHIAACRPTSTTTGRNTTEGRGNGSLVEREMAILRHATDFLDISITPTAAGGGTKKTDTESTVATRVGGADAANSSGLHESNGLRVSG